jgi:hypothetical protein
MGVVIVLSLLAIPLSVLIGASRDPTMRRRSRFRLRFTGVAICIVLPLMASLDGALGDQLRFVLVCLGLGWALLLVAMAPVLLFRSHGPDPGPSDEGGGGPGPGDDHRPPDRPIGGIPLPDAEQLASRARGPHASRRPARPRRGARERERRPSRL